MKRERHQTATAGERRDEPRRRGETAAATASVGPPRAGGGGRIARGSRPPAAVLVGFVFAIGASAGAGCTNRHAVGGTGGGELTVERRIADAMYAVLAADRAIYTREVVDRLQNRDKVLRAGEHFRDEKLLPLPAQMLRMSAEELRKQHRDLAVALLSEWPINRQNAAHTDIERAGLRAVVERPEQPYTAEEVLGNERYFTAIYPDKAVSAACVSCHNGHEQSPRHDFKLGDVVGGVVIRVARR